MVQVRGHAMDGPCNPHSGIQTLSPRPLGAIKSHSCGATKGLYISHRGYIRRRDQLIKVYSVRAQDWVVFCHGMIRDGGEGIDARTSWEFKVTGFGD